MIKPRLIGGIGEINFGKQFRQGNRVYDSETIAMCLHSQPVGNTGGNSYLYLVDESKSMGSDSMSEIKRKTCDFKPFNYVSLFSGVGGFEQALNKLGGTCVFASEIDKFAAQAYETLYGEKPAGDITKIDAEDIPDHDLLVGGFPCQSFSVAGKRKGFEDTRGTLFFDIARIASAKQPRALLLENVKGLVNHDKGNTLDTMIRTLNDIGYIVDFDVLNSKYFGVPQNRERIFIVAIRKDLIVAEEFSEEATKGNTIVPKGKRRIGEWADVFNFDWPEQDEVMTRLRDILEPVVDEKYYLDEEKTARLVAQLTRETADGFHAYRDDYKKSSIQGTHVTYAEGRTHALTVAHVPMTDAEPQMLGHVDLKGHDAIKRVYSAESIGPTLTTMGGGYREPKIAEEIQYPLKATCLECRVTYYVGCGCSCDSYVSEDGTVVSQTEEQEWQGEYESEQNEWETELRIRTEEQPQINIVGNLKPEGSTRHGQRDMVYGDNGLMGALNASDYKQPRPIAQEVRPVLTPDRMVKHQNGRRFKKDGEESFTLTAQDKHGVAIGNKPRYRIRKLTPLECFRLQAFPDEAHQTLVDAGISDSQRYKMAGNAVTVNVIDAIGERLIPLITPSLVEI